MNATSYFKFLCLAFLTVLAIFYLGVVFVAVWNLIAPAELCWITGENLHDIVLSLFAAPVVSGFIVGIFILN